MKKSTLALPFATVALVVSFAETSRADDSDAPPMTTTTPIQPGAQPYVQQQTTVQPAQTAPPVGKTTTTQAPYAPYAPYPPAGPAPYAQRYETVTERRPNRALLSTGTGLFVLSYAPSVIVAAVSARSSDKNLYIPVAGPWLDLGERNCDLRSCGNREAINKALIIASGAAQGLGVLLAVGSLFIPETERTRTVVATSNAKPSVHVTPVAYVAGGGVGATGSF
ncbi:MAG: hypothetical protein JWP87_1503 [Labilithrix sp.]|nr:hypothetical protein [Labilithrix sp.]